MVCSRSLKPPSFIGRSQKGQQVLTSSLASIRSGPQLQAMQRAALALLQLGGKQASKQHLRLARALQTQSEVLSAGQNVEVVLSEARAAVAREWPSPNTVVSVCTFYGFHVY